jgi:hypothetical protein
MIIIEDVNQAIDLELSDCYVEDRPLIDLVQGQVVYLGGRDPPPVWVSMAQPAQHPRPEQSRACHRSFFTGC